MNPWPRFKGRMVGNLPWLLRLLGLVSCLGWGDQLLAQQRQIRFERIGLEQGLSHGAVVCMLQDRRGFLWFGTQDGLNRFDGYKFTIYKKISADPNSISDNFITSLAEDSAGRLWVGTANGLNRFNREEQVFERFQHDPADPQSISHNTVISLRQDRVGRFWVGTDKGLNQLDLQTGKFRVYRHDPDDPASLSDDTVYCVYEDDKGGLWVGTREGGFNRFYPEENRFERYQPQPDNPNSLSHINVYSIFEDNKGILWLATRGGGLNRFDPNSGEFRHFRHRADDPDSLSDDDVFAVFQDHDGDYWVGTSGGFNKFNPVSGRFTVYKYDPANPHSLSHERVFSIYEDRCGVLWVGTLGGLNKFDLSSGYFTHYTAEPEKPGGLSHHWVRGICEDNKGRLWIGTNQGGLNRFDPDQERFSHYRHDPKQPGSLSHNQVWAVAQDRAGKLWAGTGRGLNRFDEEIQTFARFYPHAEHLSDHPANQLRAILEDRAGNLWVATLGGLFQFDRGKVTFTHLANPGGSGARGESDYLLSLHEDREGMLWLGSKAGLHRVDPAGGAYTTFRHSPADPTSLSHDRVLCIAQDSNATFWVGTDGGGLNRFDPATGRFQHFRESQGLPNDSVYAILEDRQGNLWMTTNKGMAKFDPRGETFQTFDVRDGLQNNEFNMASYCAGRDGRLYFGGINGFNAFFPSQINRNPFEPTVVLTDLMIFNEPITLRRLNPHSPLKADIGETQSLTLDHSQNVFTFEFAGLHYASSERNRYAYKLEGFNSDWIHTGADNRYATYTNIDPGRYVFRVKAANKDGVWSQQEAAIELRIVPPFWRRWWFHGLEVAAGLVLLFLVLAWQRRQLRRQKGEAMRAFDLRRKTEELEFARKVQLSMLPKRDLSEEKFEIVGRMRTASEVGGDYFDFFELDKTRTCIVWGDATGHGMSAGLVVGMTKAALINSVQALITQPIIKVIHNLNHTLKASFSDRHIGMCFGLAMLDLEHSMVELCSAGMPYPYHYNHRAGTLEPVVIKCPPLGFIKQLPLQNPSIPLQPDDMLILLSDGFAERFSPAGQCWGAEALQREMLAICLDSPSAAELADRLFAACDAFAAGRINEDDMTVVILRMK